MLSRRNIFLVAAGGALVAACTNNQIDPQKVLDALKAACGILVPVATIVEMLKLDPTMSASAIVNLLCTGFQTSMAERKAALSAGSTIEYDVTVNGQTVHVVATKQ